MNVFPYNFTLLPEEKLTWRDDIGVFEEKSQEILGWFVERLSKDKRYLSNVFCEETESFYFNQRGSQMIERYQDRLARLAAKVFNKHQLSYLDLTPINLIEE